MVYKKNKVKKLNNSNVFLRIPVFLKKHFQKKKKNTLKMDVLLKLIFIMGKRDCGALPHLARHKI